LEEMDNWNVRELSEGKFHEISMDTLPAANVSEIALYRKGG